MPYFSATVLEKKPGSKRRRKMAVEATNREQAKILFHEKCVSVQFTPDFTTLKEISRKQYEKIIATLVGKQKY